MDALVCVQQQLAFPLSITQHDRYYTFAARVGSLPLSPSGDMALRALQQPVAFRHYLRQARCELPLHSCTPPRCANDGRQPHLQAAHAQGHGESDPTWFPHTGAHRHTAFTLFSTPAFTCRLVRAFADWVLACGAASATCWNVTCAPFLRAAHNTCRHLGASIAAPTHCGALPPIRCDDVPPCRGWLRPCLTVWDIFSLVNNALLYLPLQRRDSTLLAVCRVMTYCSSLPLHAAHSVYDTQHAPRRVSSFLPFTATPRHLVSPFF